MLNVAVVYGGQSGEHEVSIQSAKYVLKLLKNGKYNPIPVAIDKQGRWFGDITPEKFEQNGNGGIPLLFNLTDKTLIKIEEGKQISLDIDVFFPVLHGPYGEDGSIQGMLDMLDIPYVGSEVLGSAVAMDKAVSKNILENKGFPVAPYTTFKSHTWNNKQQIIIEECEKLGYPLFIKPANLGSSVGITKAKDKKQLIESIEFALLYDHKIVVEKGLTAKEIEVSIIGNEEPIASTTGEIIPTGEFYDYEAKYIEKSSTTIPANVDDTVTNQAQKLAKEAFLALDLKGISRVDFFYEEKADKLWINEINTMPGFTPISMYPKLLIASGFTEDKLADTLVKLALKRHKSKKQLKGDR
ncbi:D-alanine--D-alanine ligase family protein [Proteinivorax tanatarense]|uniref:D-alanine--D-alanine ligase n=1 Tax=Proteinivorax tanatarense TaxID=1260629 RepID=A0AAU7VP13_9FIRM